MKKLVITNRSTQTEEHLSFWIDEKARTLILSGGRQLRISRLDKSWISASNDELHFEFNRSDGTLTYAGSTTQGNLTTAVIGSGHCEEVSAEKS
jgi:hypothetical protein